MNQIDSLGAGPPSELLHSFVVVARAGSVTKAAETLGRTQSAVSVQMRRLEDILGVALFERRARGVALTGAGEVLLPRATRVIEELRGLQRLFVDPLRGRVRLGLPDDYDQGVLQDILEAFRAAHPNVEITVRLALSVSFPRMIERSELDLAIYTDHSGGHAGRTLAYEPLVWAAAASWSLPTDGVAPLALFDRACWWRDHAVTALTQAGVRCAPVFESESVRGVKAAIASGLAVGLLAARTLEAGMRVLDERDGFPTLEPARITLLTRPTTAGDGAAPAVEAMSAAILRVFQRAAGS